MCNLCLYISILISSHLWFISFKDNFPQKIENETLTALEILPLSEKFSRLRGKFRIGPHNKDILSIIFGSLLGDAHGEKRKTGTGNVF